MVEFTSPADRRMPDGMSLDPKVWFRVSNTHRHVCRLPEGMSAIEALERVSPGMAEQMRRQFEQHVRAQFLRVYSGEYERRFGETGEICRTLTEEEFRQFKADGGEPP